MRKPIFYYFAGVLSVIAVVLVTLWGLEPKMAAKAAQSVRAKLASPLLYFRAHYRRENPTRLQRDYEVLPRVIGRGRYLGNTEGSLKKGYSVTKTENDRC